MKRTKFIYIFVASFILTIFLFSCEKEDNNGYDSLSLIEEISFSSEVSEQTISFSTNHKWEIVSSTENNWYTVTPQKGNAGLNEVTIKVSENIGDNIRTDDLSIKSGDLLQKINILQDYSDQISVVEDELLFSSQGGEQIINLKTNKQWEAALSNPLNDWCELIPSIGDTDAITLSVKVNKNIGEARQETLSITVGKKHQTVLISQEKMPLTLQVTKNSYPNWEDADPFIKSEFGEGWILADWQDILRLEDPRGWAIENGFWDGYSCKISFNGNQINSGMGYYISYYPNGKPEGFGAHGEYECFFVGLWGMNTPIVAKK